MRPAAPAIDQNVHLYPQTGERGGEKCSIGPQLTFKTDRFSMTAQIMQISNFTSEIAVDRPQ